MNPYNPFVFTKLTFLNARFKPMKNYLFILFVILCSGSLTAQIEVSRDVLGSAGNEISNGTLQMSFTVGEVFTQTLENTEIHTLGFQQSDRWFASVNDPEENAFQLFPNPASTVITIQTTSKEAFTYEIQDLVGRIILKGKTGYSGLRLDISDLPEGKYLFNMISEKGVRSTQGFITIH